MHQDPSPNMSMLPQFPEHEHLNCPRCDSTNTKFCYYNNYNLSQPRHFCKNCRRYWTKGGTLRKIPIGGGTRKTTKRSSTSSKRSNNSSPSTSPATTPPQPPAPAQLKPVLSPMFDISNDQGKLRLNHLEQIGSFVDVLRPKSSNGSEDGGLNRAPATGFFLRNYLSVNDDDDRIRSGGGGGGESSIRESGRNGWNYGITDHEKYSPKFILGTEQFLSIQNKFIINDNHTLNGRGKM